MCEPERDAEPELDAEALPGGVLCRLAVARLSPSTKDRKDVTPVFFAYARIGTRAPRPFGFVKQVLGDRERERADGEDIGERNLYSSAKSDA